MITSSSNNERRHYFAGLDSLRGIAALMVVLQHLWEINYPSEARLKPWLFFCAGHEAVIFFFVLSGFVLSHQLRNYQPANYGQFVLRRVWRIYPAYYLAVAVSAILLVMTRYWRPASLSEFGFTSWFYIWSQTSFDKTMILGSLTLLLHEGNSLNMATWSLFYEMWLSLAFPLVISLLQPGNRGRALTAGVVLLLVSCWWWATGSWLDNPWQSLSYYAWYFLLGLLLYRLYPRLQFLATRSWLLIGCGFYFADFWLFGQLTNRLLQEITIALGSSLILVNGLHNHNFKRWLAWPLVKFYGKISYSLYLFHLPVLYALAYWWLPVYGTLAFKPLVIVLTSLVASVSYYLVELPAINYAKKLVKRWGL